MLRNPWWVGWTGAAAIFMGYELIAAMGRNVTDNLRNHDSKVILAIRGKDFTTGISKCVLSCRIRQKND